METASANCLWLEAQKITVEVDFLYQDLLLAAARLRDDVMYLKREFILRSGIWRGLRVSRPKYKPKPSLVFIGHSDRPLSCFKLLLFHAMVRPTETLCSNLTCIDQISRHVSASMLPLGLTNPSDESALHVLYGNFSQIRRVMLEAPAPVEPTNLRVYANFSASTAPQYRAKLWALCDTIDSILVGRPDHSEEGRLRYLREMRDCGVVLCPRGNGRDTHRFYEALYVGAVPVVLESDYSARVAKYFGLPFVALRSWNDLHKINEVIAQAAVQRTKAVDLTSIRGSTWLKKIERA